MNFNSLVKKYGDSFFSVAKQENCLDSLLENYKNFMIFLEYSKYINEIFISPVISKKEKLDLLEDIVKLVGYDTLFYNFLRILILNNRFKYLTGIYDYILYLNNEYNNILVAIAIFAYKPTDEIINRLKDRLSSISGYSKVELELKINKNIIGGFIVKYKDIIIDASIECALQNLVNKVGGVV
ncbi:MAG: ATP synthase F1 subunit delta [Deferribacterota bacterium]|nr:ATP synthase F1 subunit delta [Deferribacterota bacterium]